jgi:hypothetical protein
MAYYHLDLACLPLGWLEEKIASHEIVPARKMLQDKMDERFAVLREAGMNTVADVVAALKTREDVRAFAARTGLPEDYLTWLAREARSYRPNPFALRDIPSAEGPIVARLEQAGVKTTKALFDRAASRKDRARLAEETGIAACQLLELVRLADLARIRGMGKTFVRLFAEAGVDSVRTLAAQNPVELRGRLEQVNQRRPVSAVVPSLKDVKEYVEMANELPKVLEA